MRIAIATLLLVGLTPAASFADEAKVDPLPQAHAHNDYRHARPLHDAIEHGFCGVEADIFLVDGELRVGHDRSELRPGRTLQKLYLDPLKKLASENEGRVFSGGPTVTLLIDIKTDGEAVYDVLREVLESYSDLLSSVDGDRYSQGAVQIVISGDRPKKAIASDQTRFVGIDGRLSDLDSNDPAHLMPMISDRWSSHFTWRGVGPIPPDEREKLQTIVRKAHQSGRRVRFWATPEQPALWRELLDAGVDHINTDQLDQLQAFLRAQ